MRKAIILLTLLMGSVALGNIWLPPAKYATGYTLYFSVYDSNSPWANYETAPAVGDIHVFQDGASEARPANAVTDIGRTFSLVLTTGEMTAAVVTVDVNDASSPSLFGAQTFYIPTYGNASALQAFDLDSATVSLAAGGITSTIMATDSIGADELKTDGIDEIVDGVLDELLTGGSHRVKNSTADYIRRGANSGGGGDTLIVEDGTCTGGTANTITLAAGASATNDIYAGMLIVLNGGTGSPQSRVIVGYAGATKIATVDKNWITTPVNASTTYQVIADAGSFYSDQGTAQAGDATTITLATTASAANDIYNGFFCRIISGTGSAQTRTITGYVGSTKVATVSAGATDWSPAPDGTSVYVVIPGGNIVSDNPAPTAGLSASDVYEVLEGQGLTTTRSAYLDYLANGTYGLSALQVLMADANDIITTVSDGGVEVEIDAEDLMTATITGYTDTPLTLGWLWQTTLDNLP